MEDCRGAEAGNSRSAGHGMTMGTASTMASMAESLGMTLPGNAAIPAVDSRRYVLAHMSGSRAVEMVIEDLRLSKILTKQAFENAIVTNGAIGGSTNAVVHLRSEEHTSELQSLMRISYAVFCLKKKTQK